MIKKTFDEVVLFARTGLNPRDNFKLGNGSNKYITIKNIHNNEIIIDENTDVVDDAAIELIHKRSQIKKGDILFCSIGRMGDMYIIPDEPEGWDINESVFAFTVDTTLVRQKYFYYVFKNRDTIEYLSKNSSGSTFKSIKMNQLKKMVFDLPSLDEQDAIVGVLDSLCGIIQKREQELDKLDELIRARFVELTEQANVIPTRMGDIATYVNGYAFKPDQWEESGFPIIRIQNLNDTTASYNYYAGDLPNRYLIHNGDVLVSWATHLEAYIWKGQEAWLNQHIFKVIFDKIEVDKTYYVYACEEALRQAFRNAHGFKPTMEHIKKADFDAAIVKLPDIDTQREFALFAEQVDKSKVVVQKALDETQTLFDSLMQEYFG